MSSNKKGVVRGTQDYQDIANLFKNKTYRKGSYNPEEIRNSNQTWQQKYDPQSFAWSVRNIVSSLYLEVPVLNTASSAATETMENVTGMMPPYSPNISPAGEHLLTAATLWKTPQHDVPWVDSSTNQNSRLTVYTQLLPGKTEKHYNARVEGQGSELLLQYTWPEEFLSHELLMKSHRKVDGSDFYGEGHNKIVAFKDHVKALRGGKSDAPVVSENRSFLMHPVEEQLPRTEVPNSIYFGNLKGKSGVVKVLAVELMGIRTNYETRRVEQEFEWSQTGAPAPAVPSPTAEVERQQRAAAALAAQRREQLQSARRLAEQHEEQVRHEAWLESERKRLSQSQSQNQAFLNEEKRRIEAAARQQYEEQLLRERQRMQQEFFAARRGTGSNELKSASSSPVTVGGGSSPAEAKKTIRPMPKVVDQSEKRLNRQQSLKDRQDNARSARQQQAREANNSPSQAAAYFPPIVQQQVPNLQFPIQAPVLQGLLQQPGLTPQQQPGQLTFPQQQQQQNITLPEPAAGAKTTGMEDLERTGEVSDDEY